MLFEVVRNLAILDTVRLYIISSIDISLILDFSANFVSFLDCEEVKAIGEVQDEHVAVAGKLSMI